MTTKKPNRYQLLAGAAKSALQGYQKSKSSEDEKTRSLKEKLKQKREARRRK